MVLDRGDGSTAFKADATFCPTPGLADPAARSYRSCTRPDRYLRHYAFALRADPITPSSPALDRQDATFLLTR